MVASSVLDNYIPQGPLHALNGNASPEVCREQFAKLHRTKQVQLILPKHYTFALTALVVALIGFRLAARPAK